MLSTLGATPNGHFRGGHNLLHGDARMQAGQRKFLRVGIRRKEFPRSVITLSGTLPPAIRASRGCRRLASKIAPRCEEINFFTNARLFCRSVISTSPQESGDFQTAPPDPGSRTLGLSVISHR